MLIYFCFQNASQAILQFQSGGAFYMEGKAVVKTGNKKMHFKTELKTQSFAQDLTACTHYLRNNKNMFVLGLLCAGEGWRTSVLSLFL